MRRLVRLNAVVLLCLWMLLTGQGIGWASHPFPSFECILANVAFWKKVYSRYTTSQGIIHDNLNLNIIYEVIDLAPLDAPGSGEFNKNRKAQAIEKYTNLLHQLAAYPKPMNAEAKRVAALFGSNANSRSYRLAAERIRCQLGQKDRFEAGLVRSGAYLNEIRAIFRAEGLPEDLCYLPHVESSFNTNAYSKFGAAGMWQFMPATGRRFMRVDYAIDERLDPIQSTRAAAKLLKANYASLGCWALALTAYNHGTAGMARAKAAHGHYPAIYKYYQSDSFKFASRNFYSEFLAAREIASNYRAYFGDIALDRPIPSRTVALKHAIALGDISRHYGVDSRRIKEINPALQPPVISGRKFIPKGYALRLPGSGRRESPSLSAEGASGSYESAQAPSRLYTVRAGDTASEIARKHGIRLGALMAANDLSRRSVLYPRQALRIPVPGEEMESRSKKAIGGKRPLDSVAAQRSNEKEAGVLSATSKGEITYPKAILASVIPLHQRSAPERENAAVTGVEPGMSQRFNLNVAAADLRVRKIVRIGGRPVALVRAEVEESLGRHAEWARVSVSQIRKLNRLGRRAELRLGQTFKIPLSNTTSAAFEDRRYQYHRHMQQDFFAAHRITGLNAYQVGPGDTYWKICHERFSIPLWLLKQCNPGVDLSALRIHQKLMIPIIDRLGGDVSGPEGTAGAAETTEAPQG